MAFARECGQWVIVTLQANRCGIADVVNDLNTWAHFIQAESIPGQNLAIAFGMQVCETVAELERLPIDDNLPECGLSAFQNLFW